MCAQIVRFRENGGMVVYMYLQALLTVLHHLVLCVLAHILVHVAADHTRFVAIRNQVVRATALKRNQLNIKTIQCEITLIYTTTGIRTSSSGISTEK